MMKRIVLAALALAFIHAACGADTPTASPEGDRKANMKIRFKLNDSQMTATLVDSKTSRDFVSLLPLTLTMNDLFGREKFAHLPRAISTEGKRTHTYEVGDIAYWSPGPDVAIFYQHDGEKIPNPGIIVIGKLDSGMDAFNVPGSAEVKIEVMRE
jgi:hypothetical protein